jgi:hypothetical protein
MLGDNKEIIAGDNSTNIQGNKVVVNQQYGMDYLQVRQVVMDVFKSNFYDLGGKVEKLVNERAEEILNKYLEKLQSTAPDSLSNTEDPDLRFVIYETQKNHARRGDNDIADILVDVLVNRTKVTDEPFLKLVTNEALEIIPKLTLRQIDMLTLIFIVRGYVAFEKIVPFDQYWNFLKIFSNEIPKGEVFYQHLQYTGCASISSVGSSKFENNMAHIYPQVFPNVIDNEVQSKLIEINPEYITVLENWNNTLLCKTQLTSVGIAIALSNFNKKVETDWGLEIWIKE